MSVSESERKSFSIGDDAGLRLRSASTSFPAWVRRERATASRGPKPDRRCANASFGLYAGRRPCRSAVPCNDRGQPPARYRKRRSAC